VLEHDLVLKSDELYLVGDVRSDGSGERATGLYLRDTRHLSRFSVTLNGTRPQRLSARVHSATAATVTLTNPVLVLDDGTAVAPHRVMLEERISLDTALHVTLIVQNFAPQTVSLSLGLDFCADFRDLFDIRGFPRQQRGRLLRPRVEDIGGRRTVILAYRGLDGLVPETEIAFDREPEVSIARGAAEGEEGFVPMLPGFEAVSPEVPVDRIPEVRAIFPITLARGERWELRVTISPIPANRVPISAAPSILGQFLAERATISTDNPFFNRILQRCELDLAALLTSFPQGPLPAAGIPWFVAPFGRDSLIVGLQTLHLLPQRAASTLRVLAALQGEQVDPWRGEEPGKILHEMRYGEMARCGEVPHTPYYGSVDATPLFVWLFAETISWTADERLYHDLLPNVRRALMWMETYGDLDGDGFIEYATDARGPAHITHQVWKDSHDSMHHADGRPPAGPIAAVEVQGYAYAAYDRLADVAASYGDSEWAQELRSRAAALRERVEAAFWLESEGFYAQGLDGEKQPVRAISSNPGHLLACGLPSPERAALVANRLRQPDMDSGWGIRTLSSAAISYNPMSYHNGSVWPHDNSLIAWGLYRYGHAAAAHAIADALYATAQADPLERLPELYCGFARTAETADAPVAYPVSCSPQAWAAGALPLIVRGMLGLNANLASRMVTVAPALPEWLGEVRIHDLHVFGRRGMLSVRREGTAYAVRADGLPIEVILPQAAQ